MKNYIGISVAANYFRGPEAVGGKVAFDETGLTFRSHALNIQTGDTRIDYDQIEMIRKVNTFGVIPNGMLIITKDFRRHQFVIYHRKKVIDFLESTMR